MEDIQRQFVNILSDSIKLQENNIYTNIKWKEVLELIEKYNVEEIVYENIISKDLNSVVGESTLNRLREKVNQGAESYKLRVNELSKVAEMLKKEEVSFIILGSLATKELYYYPEMRACNNIELLIKEDNINKVKKILATLNYEIVEENKNECRINFIDNNKNAIIVYYHLNNRVYENRELIIYERSLFKKAINLEIGESEVLSLSYEDLALKLCINISDKIYNRINYLKELSDLSMLIKNKGNLVSWDSFFIKAGMYGLDKSSIIIFILCNKLFNIEIPREFNVKKLNKPKYIDKLINDLFNNNIESEAVDNKEASKVINENKKPQEINNTAIGLAIKVINKIKENINDLISPVTREQLLKWMD